LAGNIDYTSVAKNLDGLLNKELERLDDDFLPGPAYLEKWGHQVDSSGTVPYVN
ncbi:MAG: hypothetical protein ACI9K1_002826, partial [Arcticibacterium sp.]